MANDDLLALFRQVAAEIELSLHRLGDWGLVAGSATQHRSDLAADAVAVRMLAAAGLGVLSEESGVTEANRSVVVVVDPLDGSTNAAQGLPWFAVSLCAVDEAGPLAALVRNLATGEEFTATRGGGARRDGEPITASGCGRLSDAIVGVSGLPATHFGWKQFRAYGAAALDLCGVACGRLDAFVDCSFDAHGVWDYLGGVLICREAGAFCADALGRELAVVDHGARRTPVVGASEVLLEELLGARRTSGTGRGPGAR